MNKEVAGLIMDLASFVSLLPLGMAIIRRRYLMQEQNILFALVVSAFVIEALSFFIGRILHQHNLFLLHIYTVIEFVALSTIYRFQLKSLYGARLFNVLLGVFIPVAILNAWVVDSSSMFNDYARALEAFILIMLVLSYFYKTLVDLKIQSLEREPMFWINAGVLIYFSGSLFIFIFGNFFSSSKEAMFVSWGIHAVFSIILNISYTIALWIKPRE